MAAAQRQRVRRTRTSDNDERALRSARSPTRMLRYDPLGAFPHTAGVAVEVLEVTQG